ncbi:MAG TPA: DNA-3-methyladenine glycosylase I [Puia sp.]|nr:DNA-3-methyladenine glycosylase I [Puia sp.]
MAKAASRSPSKAASRPRTKAAPPNKPSSYCEAITRMEKGNVHIHYHDKEYGFPIEEDNQLFARLILEINQAGLSWTTILNKKDNFFRAFDDFDIAKVAGYGQRQTDRLLQDAGIIRNRLKIDAAIENARRIRALQKEFGSFKNWLDHHHPLTIEEWVKLFKKTFRFTGGEIVNSFLMSIGYLPGAHIETCPIYKKLLKYKPMWLAKTK